MTLIQVGQNEEALTEREKKWLFCVSKIATTNKIFKK